LDVLTKIIIGYTTLLKAPTGFGKTILGILFAITQKKSVIWACPTNIISISIYDDVIKAIEMMGIDISVELYLAGGKIKKSNKGSDEFTSKIIITNIDSFTKPTISNSFGHRCFMIYVCPVIFDEPHDYDKMNCALNACFNNVMTTRHNYINSTTVLLTATPTPTRFLMQGGKQINVLPCEETHYPASHKQKIKIVFHKYTPWDKMKGEFVHFSHTVNDVRENYIVYPSDKLIAHGRYLDSDKEIKKNLVLNNYGKGSIRRELGVFTNQILTTACDYSVSEIFIKCPTIREFFQALGRLNRFGDMGTCTIHIIEDKSQNDIIHIGGQEENELQELFVKELKQNFSHKETDLDELYVFYNMFCEKHKVLMNAISRQNLTKSRLMIKNIFPKRYKEKLDESNDKTVANGNKMRQSPTASGMFILIQRVDSDEWITIDFNLNTNIGISNTFKEDKNTIKNQIKVLKKLDRYNKYKKITSEIMIRESIFYDTPYVVLNLKYCRDLGTVPV
jgi:CRISPR/Cas system-associated endonuclease/helicase Cas3